METLIALSILLGAIAGIVTSVSLLWVKVVKPLWHFGKRCATVVDAVYDLPEWYTETNSILVELKPLEGVSIHQKLDNIQEMLEKHISDDKIHNFEK